MGIPGDTVIDAITNAAGFDVSRETIDKLATYADELRRWQKQINLVSDASLDDIWTRHILDSAQLVEIAGSVHSWMDMGSGGGFPGLVVSILLAGQNDLSLTLVEANNKKCAFLRSVARLVDVDVSVRASRLESLGFDDVGSVDIVSARALADLTMLFSYAAPWLRGETRGLFLKGENLHQEMESASKEWEYNAQVVPSISDSSGAILVVKNLQRLK